MIYKRTRCLICQWESEESPMDGLTRTRIVKTVIDHFKKEHPNESLMKNIEIHEYDTDGMTDEERESLTKALEDAKTTP